MQVIATFSWGWGEDGESAGWVPFAQGREDGESAGECLLFPREDGESAGGGAPVAQGREDGDSAGGSPFSKGSEDGESIGSEDGKSDGEGSLLPREEGWEECMRDSLPKNGEM